MSLSDDLVRIDLLVENMVRKIEKQYVEVAGDTDPLTVSAVDDWAGCEVERTVSARVVNGRNS